MGRMEKGLHGGANTQRSAAAGVRQTEELRLSMYLYVLKLGALAVQVLNSYFSWLLSSFFANNFDEPTKKWRREKNFLLFQFMVYFSLHQWDKSISVYVFCISQEKKLITVGMALWHSR